MIASVLGVATIESVATPAAYVDSKAFIAITKLPRHGRDACPHDPCSTEWAGRSCLEFRPMHKIELDSGQTGTCTGAALLDLQQCCIGCQHDSSRYDHRILVCLPISCRGQLLSEQGGLLHDAEELLLVDLAIAVPVCLVNHFLQAASLKGSDPLLGWQAGRGDPTSAAASYPKAIHSSQ